MTICTTESILSAIALVAYIPFHERLDGDRYTILHKLGYGASSTVWLARDRLHHKYVALKIKEASISTFHNELDVLQYISKIKSDHPGRIYSAASLLLSYFWIDGPNGRHLVSLKYVDPASRAYTIGTSDCVHISLEA